MLHLSLALRMGLWGMEITGRKAGNGVKCGVGPQQPGKEVVRGLRGRHEEKLRVCSTQSRAG